MKQFLVLLKVSIKSMLLTTTGSRRGRRRRAVSGLGALVLIAFLAAYLSGVYSSLLFSALAPQKMESLAFVYMGFGALLGGLLFTTTAVRNTVFGGKDTDLLLSLPVSSTTLMASRVVAIYLENLVFCFFLLVPAGVVCAIMTQSGVGHTLLFWVRVLLCALLFALLDTVFSVLLGAGLAWLSTKFTKKALGQNLFMGLYLVVIFYFSFNLSSMVQNLAADPSAARAGLSWAAPLLWMGDGIVGNWALLGAFAAVCILPFLLMLVILGKIYRKAVTAFAGQSARSDYRLSRQGASGQFAALLKKESRRFFGSPLLFWNSGLGFLMAVGAGIFALFKAGLLREISSSVGDGVSLLVCCGILGFCLCTGAIAAPSVSLEGQSLWILREAPISDGTLLWAKTGFQLAAAVPCILISVVCLSIALNFSPGLFLALLFFSLIFEVGHACFGMLMGLTFPKLDAANEAVIVKQSMMAFLSVFAPMAFLLAAGAVGTGVSALLNVGAGTAAALSLVTGASALCVFLLAAKGKAMLCRLFQS